MEFTAKAKWEQTLDPRAPPNFWEGGTGGPACETILWMD